MSAEPEIRALEASDLPQLVELCREHADYESAPWRDHERSSGLRALLLDAPHAHCWVVVAGGELVGFASANLELSTWDAARYLHLDCIYLRPAFRGKGLGEELMRRAVGVARAAGAVNMQWQTPAWNEGAVRFYERLGATSQEKLRFTLDL